MARTHVGSKTTFIFCLTRVSRSPRIPMPRRARLSLPGIPWHSLQRGNNRSVCFHGEQDYQFYPHYVKELAEKFGCAVHAYVLMANHAHLLLTPAREDSA